MLHKTNECLYKAAQNNVFFDHNFLLLLQRLLSLEGITHDPASLPCVTANIEIAHTRPKSPLYNVHGGSRVEKHGAGMGPFGKFVNQCTYNEGLMCFLQGSAAGN